MKRRIDFCVLDLREAAVLFAGCTYGVSAMQLIDWPWRATVGYPIPREIVCNRCGQRPKLFDGTEGDAKPFLTPREFIDFVSGLQGRDVLVKSVDGDQHVGRIQPLTISDRIVDGMRLHEFISGNDIELDSSEVADIVIAPLDPAEAHTPGVAAACC